MIVEKCCILEHYDMVFKREVVADKILNYLNLSIENKNKILYLLNNLSVEKTCYSYKPLSIDTVDFSKEQKDFLKNNCSELMNKMNYSWDENYFLKETIIT